MPKQCFKRNWDSQFERPANYLRSYPPDDALSQIGLPPLPASILKQNCAKPRTYGQIQPFLDSPFAKPCETPRLHSENLLALNATHLDVFRHHSEPVSSIPGPRHGGTMFPSSQDPPALKSTQIDVFSCVSNWMLPRTGPPHLSALSPTCSEVLWLHFKPNPTILSPGPLPYQPDDGSLSPSALAGSFRPKTTSVSPLGSLALKPMHSEPILSISNPRHGVTVSPCPQDLPASKATRIDVFSCVSNLLSPQTSAP